MSNDNTQVTSPDESGVDTNTTPAAENETGSDVGQVSTEVETEEQKKKSRFQRQAERFQKDIEQLRKDNEFLRGLVTGKTTDSVTTTNSESDPAEPKLEDFAGQHISKFLEARDKYLENKLVKRITEETQHRTAVQKDVDNFNKQMDKVKEKYSDFDDVIEQAKEENLQARQEAVNFMFKSEVGGEIAYYLAKHPSTHDRIMKLPAERLYAELGKLEDKLSEKQEEQKVNKTTQAPAKLTETKGGSAPTGADPAKAARKGYAEWLAADKSRSEKEKGNIKTPQQFRRDRIR